MTDPATLTATAIATLAFTKFLESSAGKAAERFTEAAIAKMDELRQQIWAKLRGRSRLDASLRLHPNSCVKVIVLTPELEIDETDEDDEPTEGVLAGLRQAWKEARAGHTIPLSELWDGIDVK
jgi:hypothetical protein